jgi:7,8-dihydro-6-hydroxymethylpterin-pyrophosphokinase
VRAFIGLGGNIGDPRQAFVSAVREMGGIGQVVRATCSTSRSSPTRRSSW